MAAAAFRGFFSRFRLSSPPQEPIEYENSTKIAYNVDNVSVCHILPDDAIICKESEDNDIINIAHTTVSHLAVTESPNVTRIVPSHLPVATLTHLIVINCGLLKLPNSIDTLTNLQTLDVTANRLKELPDDIGNLFQLKELYIMSNLIKYLPKLSNLSLLERIETANNPLRWPPKSVCKKGIDAIKEFMIENLEVQANRKNVLSGSKAYGTSIFHGSNVVPPLRNLVIQALLAEGFEVTIDDQNLPHVMRKQIAYAADFGKPSVPLAKCSVCGMYCSDESQFKDHICRKKLLVHF